MFRVFGGLERTAVNNGIYVPFQIMSNTVNLSTNFEGDKYLYNDKYVPFRHVGSSTLIWYQDIYILEPSSAIVTSLL